MLTEMTPTESDTRLPQMTRERTSRPRSSVPRKCAPLGGRSESATFTLIGSYGATSGANAARKSQMKTSAPPRIMRGLRRAK